MKKFILLLSICILTASINAKEMDKNKSFRGIKFNPVVKQNIKSITLDIPTMCKRSDSLHAKYNYPVTIFMANCTNSNSCFSLLISVSVIPEKIQDFDELIDESKKKDYSEKPIIAKTWMDKDKSNSDKMIILYGFGNITGTVANGFYYDKTNKETYKVTTRLISGEPFPDDDWKAILSNTLSIYSSINMKKENQ